MVNTFNHLTKYPVEIPVFGQTVPGTYKEFPNIAEVKIRIMKHRLFNRIFSVSLLLFYFVESNGQKVAGILEACNRQISRMQGVDYQVIYHPFNANQAKTFDTAFVSLYPKPDSIFGFGFIIRNAEKEYLYDGRLGFIINNQTKEVETTPALKLKSPDISSFLIQELIKGFKPDTGAESITDSTDEDWEITIGKKNNLPARTIIIQKDNLLPAGMRILQPNREGEEPIPMRVLQIRYADKAGSAIEKRLISLLDSYDLKPLAENPVNASRDARDSMVGLRAPDFVLRDLNEKEFRLTDFRGKLLLLNFWEPWCGPCRMSLAHLQRLQDQYGSKGFSVLCLTKDNLVQSRKILTDRKITLTNLVTNKATNDSYRVLAIPQYYLIDKQGIIIYSSKEGYEKQLDMMITGILQ